MDTRPSPRARDPSGSSALRTKLDIGRRQVCSDVRQLRWDDLPGEQAHSSRVACDCAGESVRIVGPCKHLRPVCGRIGAVATPRHVGLLSITRCRGRADSWSPPRTASVCSAASRKTAETGGHRISLSNRLCDLGTHSPNAPLRFSLASSRPPRLNTAERRGTTRGPASALGEFFRRSK